MRFLADYLVVCPVFGWFVGGLAGLWVMWQVCGWFREFVDGFEFYS